MSNSINRGIITDSADPAMRSYGYKIMMSLFSPKISQSHFHPLRWVN